MVLNLSSVVSMNGEHYEYIYCVEACYFDKTRKHYYTSIQDVKRYFNRYKDSDNLIYVNFYKYDVAKIIDVDFKENLSFLLFKAEQKQIDAFVTGYNHYGWTKGDLSSLEEVEQVEVEQVEVEQVEVEQVEVEQVEVEQVEVEQVEENKKLYPSCRGYPSRSLAIRRGNNSKIAKHKY